MLPGSTIEKRLEIPWYMYQTFLANKYSRSVIEHPLGCYVGVVQPYRKVNVDSFGE